MITGQEGRAIFGVEIKIVDRDGNGLLRETHRNFSFTG